MTTPPPAGPAPSLISSRRLPSPGAFPRTIIFLRLALAVCLAASLLLVGCGGRGRPEGSDPSAPPTPRPGTGAAVRGVAAPWTDLARRLRDRGLPEASLAAFFNSPGLSFNPAPMETKLRELYGIFYRSDLTRSVQEKLFELGYDVGIDGRMGPGTKKVVQAFQSDNRLAADGKITDDLEVRLKVALIKGKVRDLSQYKPPPAREPSRTATYGQFTNKTALATIAGHYAADKPLFDRMEAAYGVPGQVVASIMWIETGYGTFFGTQKAAHSLASMAASANYDLVAPRLTDIDTNSEARAYLKETAEARGGWAADELRALLEYAWRNRLDPSEFPGSVYGAIGYGQFMPSNISKFAVDGNGDGRIDLFDKTDAVFSIGNFLRGSGWREPMADQEARRKVVMLYNRSATYVNTVLFVARHLGAQ
ncbi:MAG: lytic murein transglycosylase [Deltaproteobacteria bacterium]|nr:lytic murein transglycosylase [Deltaproteobacteria bacterium]